MVRQPKAVLKSRRNGENRSIDSRQSLGWLDRLQPVFLIGAIGAGLLSAKLAPEFASSLAPLVSLGVFALICLVMLGIDLAGTAKAFAERRFLATAVTINFVTNPILAWVLATVFLKGEPELAAGLILFLVTPCIGWYLVFTELAGGDSGLGVSLLALNIVLQILLLPLYAYLLAGQSVSVEFESIVSSITIYLLLPLGLAALTRATIRQLGPSTSSAQQQMKLPFLKTGVLVVVIWAMFASQADVIFENPGIALTLIVPMVAFFTIAFIVAIAVGRAMGMPYEQLTLLAFTTTSRNSEASLAIAATAFASPLVGLTVVIGPAIELPLLVLMVRYLPRLRREPESLST